MRLNLLLFILCEFILMMSLFGTIAIVLFAEFVLMMSLFGSIVIVLFTVSRSSGSGFHFQTQLSRWFQ